MASSPSISTSEQAVIENFITDCFDKSVHVILEGRSAFVPARNHNAERLVSSPSSSRPLDIRTREKCFNLVLRDFPVVLENFDMCRQSNLEPLVLDVFMHRGKIVRNASCDSPGGAFVRNLSSGRDEFERRNRSEKVVERWIVQYESPSISQVERESSYGGSKNVSRGSYQSSEFQTMYKKAKGRIIVLLRSLYTLVRLLPVHKLFKKLNALGQIHSFILSHRISSIPEPFSREEDAKMSQHNFGPIDFYFGKLFISVSYLKTLEDVSSVPSSPISIPTEFIADYVGSPLVDPLKRFPFLPGSAPSYTHTCKIPSLSPTTSPTYSDSQVLVDKLKPCLPCHCHFSGNSTSPCSITHVSLTGHTNKINDCRSSPSFSPSSSSPSNPIHFCKVILHSESATSNIALSRQKGSVGRQDQVLSPSAYNKSKKTPISATNTFSPENKLQLKMESLSVREFQTAMVLPKVVFAGKDTAGDLIGLKSPYSPPHRKSRSSSRLPSMDVFDDSDFICPFAEDDEVTNSFRVKSANRKDHVAESSSPEKLICISRLPDAAVGELIWMLRTAPPLQIHNGNTLRSVQGLKDKVSSQKAQQGKNNNNKEDDLNMVDTTLILDITSSDHFISRTVANAFKELQEFKNFKELILKRGGSQVRDIEHIAKSGLEDPSKAE